MALRTALCFGATSGRCLFTSIHSHRPFLKVSNFPRGAKGFRRLREVAKETSIPETLVETTPPASTLWKPLGFTILFGGAAHVGAAIWEYERVRSHTYSLINRYNQWRIKRTGWRGDLQTWWQGLSDGERLFAPICFLNALVFLAWRIPVAKPTMIRYFCANPASRAVCWPMLLSTFSHYSLIHLGVNMYVLHSFITAAVITLGPEQFTAMYLTSGVVSSFMSHLYKVAFSRPGMSLGASGAIMGIVGFISMQYPDTRLSIAFLPMITFTAGNAIKGLLLIDATGCLLGWRFFDHAAHLGGAMWGIFWQQWGNLNLWQKREPVLSFWHSLRDPPRSQ